MVDQKEYPGLSMQQGDVENREDLVFVDSEESLTMSTLTSSFRDLPVETSGEYSKYFQRSYAVLRDQLSSGDSYSVRKLVTWPDSVFTAIINDKLRGITAFRTDITARLLINANTAQSGIYRFFAIPVYNLNPKPWLAMAQTTSFLPHIDVDINCVRTAELKLPWIFPIGATFTSEFKLWQIGVLPLCPLQTGTGDTTANFSIWINHDNFETYGASGIATFQSGESMKEAKQQGYISTYLNKFSKMFNILQPVPIIGNYMPVLSTTTDLLSKAAKVWGLSAPYVSKPPRKVVTYNNASYPTGSEPFVGKMLAVSDRNFTPSFKRTGNAFDEMAIPYIASKYWYYSTSTFSETEAGTELFTLDVNPSVFYTPYTATAGITQAYAFSPLLILTRLGKYWRGGIKFRFTFACTKLHTGRVEIVFGSKASPYSSETAYRKIVDISEHKSVEFTVPYLVAHAIAPNMSLGTLKIFVDEKLRAPAMVSNTVLFTTEIAAADDFEIIGFRGDEYNGEINPPLPIRGNFEYQSGCLAEETNFEKTKYEEERALIYVGEKIVSLRLLTHSFLRVLTIAANADTTPYFGYNVQYVLTLNNLWPNPLANIPTVSCFHDRITCAFYGVFGGFRVRFPFETNRTYKIQNNDMLSTSLAGGIIQPVNSSDNGTPLQVPYSSNYAFLQPRNGNLISATATTYSSSSFVFTDQGAGYVQGFAATADDFDAQMFLGWPILRVCGYPTSVQP